MYIRGIEFNCWNKRQYIVLNNILAIQYKIQYIYSNIFRM